MRILFDYEATKQKWGEGVDGCGVAKLIDSIDSDEYFIYLERVYYKLPHQPVGNSQYIYRLMNNKNSETVNNFDSFACFARPIPKSKKGYSDLIKYIHKIKNKIKE